MAESLECSLYALTCKNQRYLSALQNTLYHSDSIVSYGLIWTDLDQYGLICYLTQTQNCLI